METGADEAAETSTNGVVISDPKAIRALAHPARLRVIEEMFASQETATSTELARLTDLTPSAMSYHLRSLEKWGFVVAVANDADARERRWKAAGDSLSVVPSAGSIGASTNALLDVSLDSLKRRIDTYNESRKAAGGRDVDWDAAVVLSSYVTSMTLEQRKDLICEMKEVLRQYEPKGTPEASEAPSAERIHILFSMLPEEKP